MFLYHSQNLWQHGHFILLNNPFFEGDQAIEGIDMQPCPGHYTDDWKPEGFDTKQVFLSPSIRYAGLDAYASPSK